MQLVFYEGKDFKKYIMYESIECPRLLYTFLVQYNLGRTHMCVYENNKLKSNNIINKILKFDKTNLIKNINNFKKLSILEM